MLVLHMYVYDNGKLGEKRGKVAFARGIKGNILVLTRVNVCVKTKLAFVYQS